MKVTLYNKETKKFESFEDAESVTINKDNTLISINYPVTNIYWDGHTERFSTLVYQLSSIAES